MGLEHSCCNTAFLSICLKNDAIKLHMDEYSWVVKIRNTSEAVLRPQYTPWLVLYQLQAAPQALIRIIVLGSRVTNELIILPQRRAFCSIYLMLLSKAYITITYNGKICHLGTLD